VRRGFLRLVLGLAAVSGCSSPSDSTANGLVDPRACEAGSPPPGGSLVSIDLGARFQTVQGFGTTQRLFDDPHVTNTFDPLTKRAAVVVPAAEQAKILATLYTELGLTRVRYNPRDPVPDGTSPAGLEPVNDNADPKLTDLTKFNFSWKNNDGHIDLVKREVPYGVTTYFASPLTLESFMTESNPDEYVEWAMAILRRWRDRGLEMPFYAIVNEPGYARSGIWSGNYLRDVTKRLGAALRAEGFRTKIVVPDDVSPAEAYARAAVILADPVARQYVGAIAYHLYDDRSGRDKLRALGEQYGIPIWMTEYASAAPFEWAELIHEELAEYGASAVDMQWGFFGQWEPPESHLITVTSAGNAYTGFVRTKSFYTMGQFSRFVRPGARRVGVTESVDGLKVSAYVNGSEVVIVAITSGTSESSTVTMSVTGGACAALATGVRTSANENWAPLTGIPVSGNRFTATLPPASITTFIVK
jgi:O-glycosyl hydrolase